MNADFDFKIVGRNIEQMLLREQHSNVLCSGYDQVTNFFLSCLVLYNLLGYLCQFLLSSIVLFCCFCCCFSIMRVFLMLV